MSEPLNNRSRRISRADIQTLVLVALVIVAAVLIFRELRREAGGAPPPSVDVSDGVTTDEAEVIMQRANDAANFVSSLLSFLEVTFGAISIGLIGGAWILRGMILDQVDEVREFAARTEDQLKAREESLRQLEERLLDELSDVVERTRREVADAKNEAQQSFRVLRLQLLAEQQVRSRNIDTAIHTLQNVLEIDPDDHVTNYLLGYLYTSRKEIDRAIRHLEHALSIEPDFTPGIAALGLALRRKGDSLEEPDQRTERDGFWAQAEAKLHMALSRDPNLTDADGESYFGTLGGLYRRQERYYAALDAYERAHHVTPDSSYPVINLAALHKHQGNDEQANFYFDRVVKSADLQLDDDPRDAWTRCDLAQARLVLGDPQEALRQIQIVIDQNPERGVLATVRSGLDFLVEAPEPIDGLEAMIRLVDAALAARDAVPESARETREQSPVRSNDA